LTILTSSELWMLWFQIYFYIVMFYECKHQCLTPSGTVSNIFLLTRYSNNHYSHWESQRWLFDCEQVAGACFGKCTDNIFVNESLHNTAQSILNVRKRGHLSGPDWNVPMHCIKPGLRHQDLEGIHLPSFRFSWKLKKLCRFVFFVFESWQTGEDVMVLPCDFAAVCHESKTKKSNRRSFNKI
jgi:hypothetical protein